jgi:C4-dicarboxylate-binding protein DctP
MEEFFMKKMWLGWVFTLILMLLVGCSSSSSSTSENTSSDKPIVIKFSHVTSPDSPKGKAAELFKKLAKERTDGRVKVEVYPSSQLFDDDKALQELPRNTVQIIAPSATKLVSYDPAFQIVDLPFLFTSDEAVYKFFDGEGGQKLSKKLEKHNIKVLGMWANGSKHFTNAKRPLKTPEDFKGLKFRTQTGKVLEKQFEVLGASAVPMAFADVYVALQQGTIDGQENTLNNIDTQSYAEVQKYLTVSGHGRLDYPVLTNAKFWNELPEDIRTTLEEVFEEVTVQQRKWSEELNQQSYENLKASGLEVYELTEEEIKQFQEAMQPVYDEFADAIGKDLIELAKKLNE